MGNLFFCRGSDTDTKSDMVDSPNHNIERAVHVKKKPRKVKTWPTLPVYFGENNRFEFKAKIASGGYAFVYSGFDRLNEIPVAIKVPNTERPKAIEALKKEKKFIKVLHKGGCKVPEMIWFGHCGDRPVMVMELLGNCLGEIRKQCGRTFSLSTILRLAVELIETCRKVHSCGILHRDCKLKNYLLGPDNAGNVYLVDFGLSGRWQKNGKHVPFEKNLPPYGTMRYAPLAVHLGHEQGRKDDLEALGYMLVYLARGKLPWQSLWHEDKKIIWRDVGRMKEQIDLETLCQDLCPCFEQFLSRLKEIEFSEEPPYEELKEYFLQTMYELNISPDTPYDWELLNSDSERSETMI